MKKRLARKPPADPNVALLMRKPKRTLALMVAALDKRNGDLALELVRLRAQKSEFEADKARLGFLLSRQSTLEEWAKSARRVVFAFPGITDE